VANFSNAHPTVGVFSALGALLSSANTHRDDTSVQGIARFTNLGVLASTTEYDLVLVFEVDRRPQQKWNGSNFTVLPVTSLVFNVTDPRGTVKLILKQAPSLDWAAFGGQVLTVTPVIICGTYSRCT
jgi:hypothetical protein